MSNTTINTRLREERKRLHLLQKDVAALVGMTPRAQLMYESGERCPDSKYLALIADAGFDVLYILTGKRQSCQSLRHAERPLSPPPVKHPMNTTLTFENTELDLVTINGAPWLKSTQIGSALGHRNPRSAMADLFDRFAEDFTPDMTQLVALSTDTGTEQVRVFSPRGSYLMAFLAGTEKALDFQQWLLDALGDIAGAPTRLTVDQQIELIGLRMELLKDLERATAAGLRLAIWDQLRHVSHLLGMTCPDIESIGRTLAVDEQPAA